LKAKQVSVKDMQDGQQTVVELSAVVGYLKKSVAN